MADESSKVLTLVFTDLADSTALKTERGDVAVGDLIARHRDHVTRLAEECAGRVIDWAGDGCFLTFDTSSAGVLFALRLEQAHADDADLPGVRIGIHMGEVTEKEGPGGSIRIEGLAVDIAARISSLAKPGQVLMSSAVYSSARQRLGVDAFGKPVLWQTHGTYELKGFDEPLDIGEASLEGFARLEAPKSAEKARLIRRAKRQKAARVAGHKAPKGVSKWLALVSLIAVIGMVAYVLGTRQTAPQQEGTVAPVGDADAGPFTSIAVLPLDNLSGDPEQEFFSDGMTEAITAELANIKALKVISRTSVMQYKDSVKTMPQIATELGVDALIEGSVLRDGDDVRITVQLVDGRTDAHIWADSYTDTLTSVLQLQSDVALAIAERIRVDLSAEERSEIADVFLVDPKAYEAYLRGNYFYYAYTEDSLNKSAEAFSRAIELDPEFAAAHARLAMALWAKGWWYEKTEEDNARKQRAIADALALDPNNDDARVMAAWTALVDRWDWDQAEREIRTALELNPNNPDAHNMLSWYYYSLAQFDAAIAAIEPAIELDPLSLAWNTFLADFMFARGQLEASLEKVEAVLELDSAYFQAVAIKARVLHYLGRTREALEYLESRLAVTNRHPNLLSLLADIAADEGRFDQVREIARELQRAYERGSAAPTHLVQVYAALGEWDDVNEWMERASATRDNANVLPHYPADHRVWGRPSFNAMLDRMNYPGPYPEPDENLRRSGSAPIEKIAVLPFDNMSSEPEQEFFTDAMTEALIAELAKIRSLKVISRTSVMRYKERQDITLRDIARELDVDALVEGSVFKAGDSVRITAQLIHGVTDEHLWSSNRTAPLENVLKLQADVALSMADEINVAVTPEERRRIESARTVDPRAYDLYAQGQIYLARRDPEDFATARRLFESALALDPGFAPGHVGLSDVYYYLREYGLMPATEAIPKARAEALKALELDPNLGDAHAALGNIYTQYDWNWEAAERSLARAIELNPGHAPAYHNYMGYLLNVGRAEEALEMELRAYELDPASPIIGVWLASLLRSTGNEAEADKQLEAVEMMYPDLPRVRAAVVENHFECGRDEQVLEAVVALREVHWDPWSQANREIISLIALNREDEARHKLEELVAARGDDPDAATSIAEAYVAFGDIDSAMKWYEFGYETRANFMEQIAIPGRLLPDALANDPRFQDLLRRMNFPQVGSQ